jgi:hypothetical protein
MFERALIVSFNGGKPVFEMTPVRMTSREWGSAFIITGVKHYEKSCFVVRPAQGILVTLF